MVESRVLRFQRELRQLEGFDLKARMGCDSADYRHTVIEQKVALTDRD